MKNDWILDVLSDLRSFATANGLPKLAEQLDDTVLLAACELVSVPHGGDARGANARQHELCRDVGGSGTGL
ncbi:hypothetical protein [uncultured Lentibacter sp.]|uniref:hypothetical protein n=1 Tax=uncultured Lentibacter sp. TaxID=1659309 RepID=UPI0026041420|nr:hypothetical protein [uncultured Lentibacter sp.]MCW1955303.1 hypothetical protein [Roseobacter sp.]